MSQEKIQELLDRYYEEITELKSKTNRDKITETIRQTQLHCFKEIVIDLEKLLK